MEKPTTTDQEKNLLSKKLFLLISGLALLAVTLVLAYVFSTGKKVGKKDHFEEKYLLRHPTTGHFETKSSFFDLVLHELNWEETASNFPNIKTFTRNDWLYLLKAYRPDFKDEDLVNVDKMMAHAKGVDHGTSLNAFVLECLCQLGMHEMIQTILQKRPDVINFGMMPGPAICLSSSLKLDFMYLNNILNRALESPCIDDQELIALESRLSIGEDNLEFYWDIQKYAFKSNRVEFFKSIVDKLQRILNDQSRAINILNGLLGAMHLQENQEVHSPEQNAMLDYFFKKFSRENLKLACEEFAENKDQPIFAAANCRCAKLLNE